MSPSRMTMATHDTMSAWFWITNSWLRTGGLLFFFLKPIALERAAPGVDVPVGEDRQMGEIQPNGSEFGLFQFEQLLLHRANATAGNRLGNPETHTLYRIKVTDETGH